MCVWNGVIVTLIVKNQWYSIIIIYIMLNEDLVQDVNVMNMVGCRYWVYTPIYVMLAIVRFLLMLWVGEYVENCLRNVKLCYQDNDTSWDTGVSQAVWQNTGYFGLRHGHVLSCLNF